MSFANSADLTFVIKMRDRISAGLKNVKDGFKKIGGEVKQAAMDAQFLSRNVMGVRVSLDDAARAATRFVQSIALRSTHSSMMAVAGAAQLIAAAFAGSGMLGLVKFGSSVGLLPKFMGQAAKAADGLANRFDLMGKFLERLQTSKNPFLKFVGWVAGPAAQLATVTVLLGKLKGLGDFELKLFKRPMFIGPIIEQIERMAEAISGKLFTAVDKASGGMFTMIDRLGKVKQFLDMLDSPVARATFAFTTLGAAAKSFFNEVDFQREFQKAFTVGDAPIEFAAGIRKQLQYISLETGRSMKELAASFTLISGSGFDGAEALQILEESARGAATGLGETKDVATFLMPTMRAYGDELGDVKTAHEKLLTAVQQGAAESEDFAKNFGQVFGIAKQAGISYDELIALSSAMTLTGLSTSEAVTAVRQSITDAIGPSRQGLNILAKYGMTLDDIQKSVRDNGIVETFAELEGKLSTLDFQRLFDQVQGRSAMLSIVNDFRDEYEAVRKEIETSFAGSTEEAFATLQQSAAFAADRGVAVLNNLLLNLALVVAPPLNAALNWLAENFDTVQDVIKQVFLWCMSLFVTMKAGPAIANMLAGALGALYNVAAKAFAGVGMVFSGTVNAIRATIAGIAPAVKTMAANVIAATAAIPQVFQSFIQMFRQGTLLTRLRMTAISAFVGIADGARTAGRAILFGLRNPLTAARMAATALTKVLPALARGIVMVGNALKTVAGIVGRTLLGVLGWLISTLMDVILMVWAFGDSWDWFDKVGGETVKWSDVMWGTFDWLGQQIGFIIDWIKRKWESWTVWLSPVIDTVVNALKFLWDWFSKIFFGMGNLLKFIVTAFGSMTGAVADSAMLIVDVMSEMADVVAGIFKGIWGAIENTFKGDLNKAGEAMMDGLSEAFTFDKVQSRLQVIGQHGAAIGKAWQMAFNSSADEAAMLQLTSWDKFVLERKKKREASAQYEAGGQKTGPGGFRPDDPDSLSSTVLGKDFTATLTKLAQGVDETYRMVEANELWGAAIDAGTDNVLRAVDGYTPLLESATYLKDVEAAREKISQQLIDNGQAQKFTAEQIQQMAMIQAVVETKQRREAEMKLDAFTLAREEAERIAKVQQDASLTPADREAAIAAIQREIEMRKERYNLNEKEIQALKDTTLAEQKLRTTIDTVQKTFDLQEETKLTEDLLGIRYESAEQYAVETARIQATAEMRRKHGEALTEEAKAYIRAAEAQARAQHRQDVKMPTIPEAIKKSWDDWQRRTQDIGTAIADTTVNAVDRMSDAFADFFTGQEVSWRDFANDVIKQIMRMITNMLILQAIQSAMNFFAGPTHPAITGPAPTGPLNTGNFGAGWGEFAKGGAFDRVRKFAKGSAFANSIVSSPTLFPFASGGIPRMGLMGEAGPEAVMPLKRLSGGRLGVSAETSGAGVTHIDARTTIVVEMKEVQDPMAARKQAQEAAGMIKEMLDQRDQQQQIKLARASRSLTYGANR